MSATQEEYDALEDAYHRAQRLATRSAERADRAEDLLAAADRMLRTYADRLAEAERLLHGFLEDTDTYERRAHARAFLTATAGAAERFRRRSAETEECGT